MGLVDLDLYLMSVEVSSAGDGGFVSVTFSSSSFSNDGAATIVEGASLVSFGGDASLSTG